MARLTRMPTVVLAVLVAASPAAAQPPAQALSLDEALSRALRTSETVQIAAGDVTRAEAAQTTARSQRLPQLFGTVSYARTLRSQFQGLGDDEDAAQPPTCDPFLPDPNLPVDQRVAALERALNCQASGGSFGSIVSRLPFGRLNQWSFGLSASQSLFTAGRLAGQIRAAGAGVDTATIALASARAEVQLTVAQAYFDALLAERLVAIASASIEQQQRVLDQTTLMQRVGTRPQFDVLRARVALDALRPTLIRQQASRQLAYVRLKQLLDIRLDASIQLTTTFASDDEPVSSVSPPPANVPAVDDRAPVREAARDVERLQALLTAAQGQRWPSVSANAQFQQVAYPSGLVPTGDFLSNWSVGFTVDVPLFTGGRLNAAVDDARASLAQGQLRLSQTRELAALDSADALLNLQAARAAWEASAGTVEQATEAYRIAEIRFREGVSTQVELSDSQLLLQQARANRAQADRDLRLAAFRVTLLADLPLATGAPGATVSPIGPIPRTLTVPESSPAGPDTASGTVAGPAAVPGVSGALTSGGLP